MNKSLRAVAAAVAVALGVVLVGCGSRTVVVSEGQQTNVITVNASSEVKVVPDKASFSAEVMAMAATAEEAQSQGSEMTNAVIDALVAAGVDEKSIQTSYTNLSPTYDWSSDEPKVTGYEQRTSLQVSDVDLDVVAALMQTCVAAGATGVYGPNYYASTYDEAYAQALTEAITASREKAAAMAKAAGVGLGDVVSIVEGYQNTMYRATNESADFEMALGGDAGGGEMKVAPGEVSVEAQVTVSYAIG